MEPKVSARHSITRLAPVAKKTARELKRVVVGTTDNLYRAKNRHQPRVLIYTDSRGKNLNGRLGKTNRGSYVARLREKYNLTYAVCPEVYTTIPDFLDFLDFLGAHRASRYDAIVMHCGIVDFSPRPLSSLAKLKATKTGSARFRDLFASNETYYQHPFDCEYYGEPTINIYSPEFLVDSIVPRLASLPQLICLNSGHFIPGWDGNYTKGRPLNIDETVTRFDAIMGEHLLRIVDIKKWTFEEIQRYTIDNVHFTALGFDRVFDLVDGAIQGVLENKEENLGGSHDGRTAMVG
jgi:hypothetical protein